MLSFGLFPCENEPLLLGRNPLFLLDFLLDVINRVGGLNFESDSFTGEGLYEDLHPRLHEGNFI